MLSADAATELVLRAGLIALTISGLFYLSRRLIKSEAAREDGWCYLTPGFVHWVAVIGSSLVALGMVVGAVFAPRLWPSDPPIVIVGTCLVIAAAFGAIAIAVYITDFRHKIRWNDEFLEKITSGGTTRIAWTEVTDYGFKKGLDHYWVRSDRARVKISPHMNGVEQLLIKLAGPEAGQKLYERAWARP